MPRKNSSSKYKYVYFSPNTPVSELVWKALPAIAILGKSKCIGGKRFKTEREAALHVDMMFIRHGLPPVNILKPVNK